MHEKIERGRANAQRALDAYRATGGQSDSDEDAITDLLADLLHLAEAKHIDIDPLTCRALGHFEHETDPDNAYLEV